MKKTKKKSARKYASGGKVQFENSREMDDYGADRTTIPRTEKKTRSTKRGVDPIADLLSDPSFSQSREMDDYGADRTRGFKKGGRVQTRGSGCAISGNTHKG